MSYKSNKTANAFDLADHKTRLQMQNEDIADLLAEDNSDIGEGPFKGSIISYEEVSVGKDAKKIMALIRIPQLHNHLIPINKCKDSSSNILQFSKEADALLVGSHVNALSTFYTKDLGTDPENYTNLEVLVHFRGETPKQSGKMRSAEFDFTPSGKNTVNRSAKGCYITGGGLELTDGLVTAFASPAGLFGQGGGITLLANLDSIGPSSAPVGDVFTVDGINYQSTPTVDAATRALELRKSAVAAGKQIGEYNVNFEKSPIGREWVKQNIYIPCLAKQNAASGKDPLPMANYWASKLSTGKESFWSSWFFKTAYINYWSAPGMDVGVRGGGKYYDYSADEGLSQRASVKKNFNNWLNKNMFITFRPEEAPLEVGDSVHNGREGSAASTFEGIPTGGPSHMRVVTKIEKAGEGFVATVNGGNEGNRCGQGLIKLDKNKRMIKGQKYGGNVYNAIYKYVKVVHDMVADTADPYGFSEQE